MPNTRRPEQYVLLPVGGLRATRRGAAQVFLRGVEPGTGAGTVAIEGREVAMRVVDSIRPEGPKLVELPEQSRLAVRSLLPSLRLVPVVWYRPAVAPRMRVASHAAPPRAATITVTVRSRGDGQPVAGATVAAFTDVQNQVGAEGVTNRRGQVRLALGTDTVELEALYVYPAAGHWSLRTRNLTVTGGVEVDVLPLDLGTPDVLRHVYGNAPASAGTGVTVGILDTGIGAHPDLVVAGGANTVTGEDPDDFGDNGAGGHGTHVAGIVAARGSAPTGVRGVAPGVSLRSYRVFGRRSDTASSFAIAKAIDQAVVDRCDLLNLSLGGGQPDPVLAAAVDDARAAGSLCIIAAGNDGRQPVSFPALAGSALAITAYGRRGTFPATATEVEDIARPFGTDRADFVAAFSNIGPEVDLIGPGVGVVSTVPGGHGALSGTSMACPAVTGAAARALAASGNLRGRRDSARSDAMVKAVLASARSLGFGPRFEGHGLPLPG